MPMKAYPCMSWMSHIYRYVIDMRDLFMKGWHPFIRYHFKRGISLHNYTRSSKRYKLTIYISSYIIISLIIIYIQFIISSFL